LITLAAVPHEQLHAPRLARLTWAIYLAASWTWCIGMFLPAILDRDFGPLSFLAFAIPNVLGAAAMGWVLARPGKSEALVARHRPAMRAFSLVTIAFHGVFLALVVAPLARVADAEPIVPLLYAGPPLLAAIGPERAWAALAYAASLACLALWVVTGARATIPDVEVMARSIELSRLPAAHVLPLAGVCTLGFLLCPYLDLTFHRARQAQAAGAARLSFTIGFGVLFALMILFTAAYAPVFWETYRPGAVLPPRSTLLLVLVHLGVQTALTTALHLRALGRANAVAPSRLNAWNAGPVALLLAIAGAELYANVGPAYARGLAPPVSDPKTWYRLFMSFYGLVFPAYALLVMAPTWRRGRPTLRHWVVLAFALACAAPAFWLGFIERRSWWLVLGVGAIVLCRGLIRPPADAAPPAPSPGPGAAPPGPPRSR